LPDSKVTVTILSDRRQQSSRGLGRLAEYFVEMQQLDLAASAGQALDGIRRSDRVVALAHVEKARGDAPAFTRLQRSHFEPHGGFDRVLPWDRG